jgi:hypothetical protein
MFERITRNGRHAALAIGAALTITLSGCSGDGAGAGGSASTTSSAASDVSVFTDKPALPASDGTTSATITAQVKDASNNVLSNQPVTFGTTDTGVSLTPVGTSTLTDASGRVQVKLDLGSSAASLSNRTVTVTASSGAVSGNTSVQVIGTQLTITGPASLAVGAAADYTIAAANGSGTPLAGLPVTVAFSGGTPASSVVTTAANGQARVNLTGVTAGAGTISASAAGVDAVSSAVQVLGTDTPFRITSPADNAQVEVNTNQNVVVLLRENGVPAANRAVIVTATRGTVNGSTSTTANTNASGEATVVVRSTSAGQSTITATVFNAGTPSSVTSRVNFVSRTPAKITLSPDPTSIGANAAGSTSSTSRLVATVRDASDNPVTGALVTFNTPDPSNGSIEPGQAITNAQGQAIASFIAGPTSTGPDAVQVTATVLNSSGAIVGTDTRNMTVSAVALFVELGTGNTIETVDSTTYAMPWSAIVTDANRNPVPGATVTVSLAAINYFKGIWEYTGGAWQPRSFDNQTLPPLECASEDANRNNLLDGGEDLNANGRLDPGSPASVRITSTDNKTGADGRATLSVIYPRSFGEWVRVTMRVTIGTSGTESSIYRSFVLPVLAGDVTAATTAPPNVNARTPNTVTPAGALAGPYGYEQDCTRPN